MPVIRCYVDDDTMKRLKLCALDMNQNVEVLVESAIAEAAIKAVPCMNGRPTNPVYNKLWDSTNAD